ncbi:S8 family serine peptidase [Flavobacterium branchiophilum]|uniref:P/Homo B domain-containing protein n=1 Tax=Flavobacterium branchiophilum TaxID=55197 RepID=A0A2H3KEC3_9FLAO|nr:S8 family serine peptidase [Flavobacterium branchiophilum]PDS26526.1 hypothetical protein B0A77_02185 [Flavobacterium branchiophilum]
MKLKTLLLLFISSFAFSQNASQRQEIVKEYDFLKIKQFKNQLLEERQNFEKKLAKFSKNNKNFKAAYTTSGKKEYRSVMGFVNDSTPLYYTTYNNGATLTTRARKLWNNGGLGLNLQGQGMIAGVWDGGSVRLTHSHFQNRVVQKDLSTKALSDHSTHVTGTIIQNKTNAPTSKGMAFDASVWANDWDNDLYEVIDEAGLGLLVSNHSYGYAAFNANNQLQLPIYYFGAYISESKNWDIIANMLPNYLMVTAAGNDRDSQAAITNKGGYDLLSGSKTAKNNMVVAAVNSVSIYNDASSVVMSSFSNWGPTDDGRIKPDICAKGVAVSSTISTSDTATGSFNGTSMASPGITGSLLLLQQHYNNVFGKYMSAAMLKGVALHTADEAGSAPGPDYSFGWGLMNCEAAANAITNNGMSSIVQENTLNSGETKTFTVKAIGGTTPLMASISWNDPAGTANTGTVDLATPVLVNDLDIKITQNTSNFLPWKLNPASPSAAATTGDNVVDPFEKIQISNASGDYTITVTHKGTLLNPQKFTLVVTGVDSNFTIRTNQPEYVACSTGQATFPINYLASTTNPTNFSVSGLPSGVTSSFGSSNLSATGTNTLTLSNLTNLAPGNYPFVVSAVNGTETELVNLNLRIYSNTFTSLANLVPANNSMDQAIYPNLTWDSSINAQTYTVEVATDSAFSNIVQTATVSTNSYFANMLNTNTEYFWRVKSNNLCGSSSFSSPLKFKTVNLYCSSASNSTVTNIGSVANTVVNSQLTFNDPSITSIYDIDVTANITHTYVQDMTIKITSPLGTVVVLQQEACGNQDDINATYDDNGAAIVCGTAAPAISGRVKSNQLLSAFAGQNPNGTWTFTVDDPYNGDGGSLNSWSINVCKQITLSNQSFDANQFEVYPNPSNGIYNIKVNKFFGKLNAQVVDINGRVVMNNIDEFTNEKQINISNLQSGIYILKIVGDNINYSTKLIKN